MAVPPRRREDVTGGPPGVAAPGRTREVRRPRPVVVLVLVLVNVAVYVATAVQAGSIGDNEDSPLFASWGLRPLDVAGGSWWQLVTSGFLHYGPVHVGLNMVALWIIGRDLEPLLGRVRFTAVYLVSLLGGSVAVLLFGAPAGQVAGASGAVFGLMGGLLVVALRLRVNTGAVFALIAVNLVLSVALPGISLLGHLGGLVVGAGVTAGLVRAPAAHRCAWQSAVVLVAVAVLVVLVQVGDARLGG